MRRASEERKIMGNLKLITSEELPSIWPGRRDYSNGGTLSPRIDVCGAIERNRVSDECGIMADKKKEKKEMERIMNEHFNMERERENTQRQPTRRFITDQVYCHQDLIR